MKFISYTLHLYGQFFCFTKLWTIYPTCIVQWSAWSAVTVTPSGIGKSVAITDCHSNSVTVKVQASPLTVTPVTMTFCLQWHFLGLKQDLLTLKIRVTH